MNLKKCIYAITIMILMLGCATQHLDTFNLEEFKKSIRSDIKITKADSAVIASTYNGDIEKYLAFRRNLLANNIKTNSWSRQSFIYKLDKKELAKAAAKFKIDSPYYFYQFMVDSIHTHPLKKKILSDLKSDFLNESDDPNILKYNAEEMVNKYFNLRAKPRLEYQTKLIHKYKSNPDLKMTSEIFMVDIQSFLKKQSIDSSSFKKLLLKPQININFFNEFIALSKANFIKTLNSSIDKTNINAMQNINYYNKRINDYTFEKAGGYNFD